MSALDDLFDGHYFTDDPHVWIPIDEAQQELADLRTENERLKEAVEEAERAIRHSEELDGYSHLGDTWLKEYGKSE